MKKIILVVFTIFCLSALAQKGKHYKIRTIAFYNLENLFDTINNTSKKDELCAIMSMKLGRSKAYKQKIKNMAYVIDQIGKKKTKTSPAVLGVAEIENDTVLRDLVNERKLRRRNYKFIHFDSPDDRAIDVALLYQPKYFKPTHYEVFNPNIYVNNRKIRTRDILWVEGLLDDEKVHFIVNHWPSRRGGEERSSPLREKAAARVKNIIENIQKKEPNAKIMVMGDFNDDPINKSFKKVLETKKDLKNLDDKGIYNPYEKMFDKGFNTLGYRDNINLFDQILITKPLTSKNKDFSSFKMFKAAIFNKGFLTQKTGSFKGYPFRSFSYAEFTGGYSDHYPVYMYLIKEK